MLLIVLQFKIHKAATWSSFWMFREQYFLNRIPLRLDIAFRGDWVALVHFSICYCQAFVWSMSLLGGLAICEVWKSMPWRARSDLHCSWLPDALPCLMWTELVCLLPRLFCRLSVESDRAAGPWLQDCQKKFACKGRVGLSHFWSNADDRPKFSCGSNSVQTLHLRSS